MKTNRMLPDFSIKKIWERLKELSTSISNCLPLTGGTLSGELSVFIQNRSAVAFKVGDPKVAYGMIYSHMPLKDLYLWNQDTNPEDYTRFLLKNASTNELCDSLRFQRHYNGTYEDHCVYGTHNIKVGTTDLTAGTSALSDGCIHLVYS